MNSFVLQLASVFFLIVASVSTTSIPVVRCISDIETKGRSSFKDFDAKMSSKSKILLKYTAFTYSYSKPTVRSITSFPVGPNFVSVRRLGRMIAPRRFPRARSLNCAIATDAARRTQDASTFEEANKKGYVFMVGSGIGGIEHLTVEVRLLSLEWSDRNDPTLS